MKPARPARRRNAAVQEVAAVTTVIAAAVITFVLQWRRPQPRTGTGDSYWYLRSAARFAGAAPATAAREAAQVYCADVERAHRLGALAGGCSRYVVTGVSPRYEAIFTSRPGLPLVAAPLVALTGLSTGMLITTALFFLLVPVGLYAALRTSGVGTLACAVGGVVVCLLPLAYWDSRMLVEGAATAGTMFAVLGAFLVLQRRGRWRVAVLGVCLVWLYATKPATGAALSALLLVLVAGVLARQVQAHGRRGLRDLGRWAALGVTTAVVAVGWWVLSLALGLPGLLDTVQDMATKHFRTPDIADPLPYLLRHALSLWWHLPRVLLLPWPLAALLIAGVVLVLLDRRHAPVWSAAALSAAVVVTAHPLRSEYPRLIAPAWILLPVALAVILDRLARGARAPVADAPDPMLAAASHGADARHR